MNDQISALYNNLVREFKRANPGLKHKICDIEVSKIWRQLKEGNDFPASAHKEILIWKIKADDKITTLNKFWVIK